MYCSKCGSAVSSNLTYCNHCGAKLSGAKDDGITQPSEVKPAQLAAFMVLTFVFGIVAIVLLMMGAKMVFGPENLGLTIALTLLSFLVMIAVEGVFFWMLLGRKKGAKEEAKELSEAKARVLPEPTFSVTEHTTRNLETIDSKRQTL